MKNNSMNKEKYNSDNRKYYVDGNAARQLQELPRYNDVVQEDYQVVTNPKPKKKRKKQPSVDFSGFIVLSISAICMLYFCVTYIQVQSDITRMNKEITTLEKNYTKLLEDNNAMASLIDTSMDLNYIYKIATNELGMVYPQDNQVIDYNSTVSDYVRQYEEIPETKESTILDRILK